MSETLKGIAHVSFAGAGFFVPVDTSSERRSLIEQIAAYSRTECRLQVLTDGRRWMVRRAGDPSPDVCASCDAKINTAACSMAGDDAAYCLGCAFNDRRVSAGDAPQPAGTGVRPATREPTLATQRAPSPHPNAR